MHKTTFFIELRRDTIAGLLMITTVLVGAAIIAMATT
jgi:hypothetical protein